MSMRILLILLLLLSIPANAVDYKPFKATYALMTGGVHMIDIAADFDLNAKNYAVRTDAKTTGIFQKLLPWAGSFATSGTAGFKPLKHDYTVHWLRDVQTGSFVYQPAGVFQSMTKTENGKPINDSISSDVTEGTRDMLSALMIALDNYENKNSCNGDVLTFDNTRSFIIRFADAGDTEMNNPNLSSYTGPAHGCSIEIIPQKGNWPKKPRGWLRIQKEAKATGKLPIIWMAKPAPDKPMIPVRVDIHTKYGDAIAHLTSVN